VSVQGGLIKNSLCRQRFCVKDHDWSKIDEGKYSRQHVEFLKSVIKVVQSLVLTM
jgi:hypothetical protein